MKRFLALLLLVVSPAFAQEQPTVVIYDPVVQQTYTLQQSPTTELQNINQTGGTALTLYDDGTTYTPINLEFDFYYFGNLFDSVYISQNGFISFTSNANGCCSGNQLPFLSDNPYWNMNNSIFAMWSDLADFNTPGNPYYKSTADSFTVGWYGVDELGTANKFTYEITLFNNNNFSIAYGDFDYAGPTGRTFTSGFQGDTSNEFWQVYNGNDPTILENKTYLFVSSEITPPPPPPPPEEPPPVIAPDCTVNPNDPTCIINALIPDTTDEEFLADTGFDDGSSDGTEIIQEEDDFAEEVAAEELFASEETSEEITEEDLEEMLADEEAVEDEEAAVEMVVALKTLENEEKASVLSDSISKDVLEAALSIAADATAAGGVAGSESTSSSSSSSSSSSRSTNETSETVVAESQSSSDSSSGEVSVAANEGDASAELLETGRVLGQEALAATLAGTETSANESMSEAESIAATSSETSMVANDSSITTAQLEDTAVTEDTQTQEINVAIAEVTDSTVETVLTETMAQAESSSEISFDVGKEMMAENVEQMISAEAQETEALAFVAASAASSEQTFEDDSAKDAEITNAMVDPAFAMANTFNQAPNMMSLEFLGVLKPIEKSDAEIRAEQVVAANKEQQDAINANYMDADQSGIVSAIAVDADVSSYLSQRLQDAPFYKPEDIYKNIVIKDNVRGSYFLEKGNTDTYKKMVEEQYK